jgi:hypothetical protein
LSEDILAASFVTEFHTVQQRRSLLFAEPNQSGIPGATFLRGDRLALRAVTPNDYAFLHEYGNDPTIREGAPTPTPVSEDDLAAFVENDERSVQFLPCHDGTPVGFVFLFGIEPCRDHAEIGC